MQPKTREGRPVAINQAASKLVATNDKPMVPAAVSLWPKPEPAWAIFYEDSDGRQTRRLYLSLHSASAAVARAESRGVTASLVLCRVVPVTADASRWSA